MKNDETVSGGGYHHASKGKGTAFKLEQAGKKAPAGREYENVTGLD